MRIHLRKALEAMSRRIPQSVANQSRLRLILNPLVATFIAFCVAYYLNETALLADRSNSWSLRPIKPHDTRILSTSDWERSHIDTFVITRQHEIGLSPSPEADRRTLARRLAFDLIGLPPDPSWVDSFVNDQHPDAYERLVDQLLASPRFGERMAQHWLDLARYADSDGYHDDTNRAMWPYRDWVIRAFNENKPYDEFTVEQLAGDLLPNATLEQKVASAFHRNAPTSSEDGANPAEYMVRYAVDRLNTTATVWLGLTLQCAECHDHKYDPVTMREYYELFAFFDQTSEEPLFRGPYAPPVIAVPAVKERAQQRLIRDDIKEKTTLLENAQQQLPSDQQAWEDGLQRLPDHNFWRKGLVAEFLFEGKGDQRMINTGTRRKPAKLQLSPAGNDPRTVKGLVGNALQFNGAGGTLDLGQLFEFRRHTEFMLGAWVKFNEQAGCVISKIDPELEMRGLDVSVEQGHVAVRMIHHWPDAAIKVTTTAAFPTNRWLHLVIAYDGSSDARGIFIYINGQSQELAVNYNSDLRGPIGNRARLLIGDRLGEAPFHGAIDDVQFHKWPLSFPELAGDLHRKIRQIIILSQDERSTEQATFVDTFFRENVHQPTITLRREITTAESALKKLAESIPKLRVMQDIAERRDTHILVQGDFRRPGTQVRPNTPALLPPLPPLSNRRDYSRLDLAHWLVASDNPLPARVTVNRFWSMCFGRGIVATLDDFGTRGALPSHPDLLDWLASDFIGSGWNVKTLLRRIATSSTYRQSSKLTAQLQNRDPQNQLLARGPRHRFPAETLRDNVLHISGLLSDCLGGPSVLPYQPPGLWRDMANGDDEAKAYVQSHREDLYRRGLYTFWKRSIHYPSFALFDAPNREICTAVRPITNTPLQALVTLNDLTFVEAARVFAERILRESHSPFDERLDYAFRHALARPASVREMKALRPIHDEFIEAFKQDPAAAWRLIQNGEYPGDAQADRVELAAWTAIAQIVLNLDETMTKE